MFSLQVEPSQCNKILASALSEILIQAAPEGHSIKLVHLDDTPQVSSSVLESVPMDTDEEPTEEKNTTQSADISPAQTANEIEVCSSDFHQRLQ